MNFFRAIGRLPWSARIALFILFFFAMCIFVRTVDSAVRRESNSRRCVGANWRDIFIWN